jgi:hypothetical protein
MLVSAAWLATVTSPGVVVSSSDNLVFLKDAPAKPISGSRT